MNFHIKKLANHRETINTIVALADAFRDDVHNFGNCETLEFYRRVLELPYIPDPAGFEVVSRPKYSLAPDALARDCDDKAVIVAAWAVGRGIPYRLIVCGEYDFPHHVYPEVFLSGIWTPFDATYPDRNRFGQRLYPVERFREIYTPAFTRENGYFRSGLPDRVRVV